MQNEWDKEYSRSKKWKSDFKTNSGIKVKPLYTASDLNNLDHEKDMGYPGKPPFVRGVYNNMYHGRPWTLRQLGGYGPPEETNNRFKFLLKRGATGVNVPFDIPSLRGYDSDDDVATAEVGKVGVAVDSLLDMEELFDSIPIDEISVSLVTCQPIGNISIQAMYFAMAEKRGFNLNRLAGTSQNDFFMETAVSLGPKELPPAASFRLSCDAIEFCTKFAKRWNPISIDAYAYRDSRLNAIQEVGLGLAHAIACVEEMLRRGYNVDDFAPKLSLFFSAHSDFFEEIAKFRAARKIWYEVMKKRFNAKTEEACRLKFHVQTAGSSLTAQQPFNNIVRSSYQALAAVLGGAQSLHVNGYDEAICPPTEDSALIALRTQQIILNESNVISAIDPLGGSFLLESLTVELEKRIREYLTKIEDLGGVVKIVETGWIHSEISEAAYKYQTALQKGDVKVVGLNCYTEDNKTFPEVFVPPDTFPAQRTKLEKLRKERNDREVRKSLNDIMNAAEDGDNIMPYTVNSAKAMVTVGEVSKALKQVFGTWTPNLV